MLLRYVDIRSYCLSVLSIHSQTQYDQLSHSCVSGQVQNLDQWWQRSMGKKWKMPRMEKFNSFSTTPGHKLICLQRQGLKWLLCSKPCIFFHSKRGRNIDCAAGCQPPSPGHIVLAVLEIAELSWGIDPKVWKQSEHSVCSFTGVLHLSNKQLPFGSVLMYCCSFWNQINVSILFLKL